MSHSILIVDDSKLVSDNLTKYLKDSSFDVIQAFNKSEAKELLKNKDFDFCLLDLNLPDGNGEELLPIFDKNENTKVIIFTFEKDNKKRKKLFSHSCVIDYIIKERNFDDLSFSIVELIKKVSTNNQFNILIVDDSPTTLIILNILLQKRGFNIYEATNGVDALNIIQNQKVDSVIADLEMPQMSGDKLLTNIKKIPAHISTPIMILSGTSKAEMISYVIKNGASDFIKKPFVPEEFILKVDKMMEDLKQKKLIKHQQELLQSKLDKEIQKNWEYNKMLIHQSKMAEMGEMISYIAHQWRQPLNALGLVLQKQKLFFSMGTLNENKLNESVAKGLNLVSQMSNTIEDFRNFFKDDKHVQDILISEVMHKALVIIEPTLEANNISVNINIKEDTQLSIIANELAQVILNILSNAMDALLLNNIKKPKIDISINQLNNVALISIEDNAGGIDADIVEHIFEPYFTTKHEHKGTGLGLYMSKTIVNDHI
ncbi:MAG: response regulator, partial [Thiovulaceae bacterium]|nr:response regulator [Sulfurimonadaceae bacterium]